MLFTVSPKDMPGKQNISQGRLTAIYKNPKGLFLAHISGSCGPVGVGSMVRGASGRTQLIMVVQKPQPPSICASLSSRALESPQELVSPAGSAMRGRGSSETGGSAYHSTESSPQLTVKQVKKCSPVSHQEETKALLSSEPVQATALCSTLLPLLRTHRAPSEGESQEAPALTALSIQPGGGSSKWWPNMK